jgi:hypothetical protein
LEVDGYAVVGGGSYMDKNIGAIREMTLPVGADIEGIGRGPFGANGDKLSLVESGFGKK